MEKTVSSQLIYAGKIINLRLDEVELQNGMQVKREVVEHPGAVAILAVTTEGQAYFVRQYRKAIEKELLEIPAGKLDAGEEAETCAMRELMEETGMKADKMRRIAFFYTSPGFASEKLFIYLATELSPASVEKPPDELLETFRLPLRDAVAMARQGKIEDGKTLIALLLAADILGL